MPKAVLVIDDNQDFREVLCAALIEAGYKAVSVGEPMMALDAVNHYSPDFCLIDIGLPGMDGYDLAQKVRQLSPKIGVIAMSGRAREPDREAQSGAEICAYLRKPFSMQELAATISGLGTCK